MIRVNRINQAKEGCPNIYFKKFSKLPISCVILTFLGLQFIAAFPLSCKISIDLCDPQLYPFLSYPMYHESRYVGDTIDQFIWFGTLEDSTEVPIRAEDLNLTFWHFRGNFILPIIRDLKDVKNGSKEVNILVQEYERIHNKKIISLRLEKRSIILTEEGLETVPTQVVKSIPTQE